MNKKEKQSKTTLNLFDALVEHYANFVESQTGKSKQQVIKEIVNLSKPSN